MLKVSLRSLMVVAVCGAILLSYHVGQSAPPFGQATETAILTGVLNNGEIIPLPSYADGTTAPESECQWIVSPNDIWTQSCPMRCYTDGRKVNITTCSTFGRANFMIIARRPVR